MYSGYVASPAPPLSGGAALPSAHLQMHPQQMMPLHQQNHPTLHQHYQQQHFIHQQQAQQTQQLQLQQQAQQQQLQKQSQLQQALDTQLQFVAVRYREVMRARHDVLLLLHAIPSLFPHTTPPAAGAPSLLVVSGTLPIAYKGSQYNIPVQFIIPEAYPHAPPVCKVSPTEAMVVKSNHKHVASSGLCYLPYLSGWRPDVCSLVGAANELKAIFAADPPVRAIPAVKHSASTSSLGTTAVDPSRLYASGSTLPTSSSAASSVPGATSTYRSHAPPATVNGAPLSSPAAFPSLPPAYAQHQQQHQQSSSSASASASRPTPPSSSPSPLSSQPQSQSSRDRLQSKVGQRYGDLHRMVELHTDKNRLKAEYAEVRQMVSQVKRSSRRKEGEQVDVDAASNPSNPKDLMIMSLKAEDVALDDAMYNLMKALTEETIESGAYLKQVRQLSREQFMVRARLHKVGQS